MTAVVLWGMRDAAAPMKSRDLFAFFVGKNLFADAGSVQSREYSAVAFIQSPAHAVLQLVWLVNCDLCCCCLLPAICPETHFLNQVKPLSDAYEFQAILQDSLADAACL